MMAKPGEYDFVPLIGRKCLNTVSLGIFQWVYRADGHGLKKSKAVYRVKGPAHKWQEINGRARCLCDAFNVSGDFDYVSCGRKSETI
jgi:hypothetical protein